MEEMHQSDFFSTDIETWYDSDFKGLLKNFHFVLIVAPRVDKSGTAYCHKDLVWC